MYERETHIQTDRQTDTQTSHDSIGRACKASRGNHCSYLPSAWHGQVDWRNTSEEFARQGHRSMFVGFKVTL